MTAALDEVARHRILRLRHGRSWVQPMAFTTLTRLETFRLPSQRSETMPRKVIAHEHFDTDLLKMCWLFGALSPSPCRPSRLTRRTASRRDALSAEGLSGARPGHTRGRPSGPCNGARRNINRLVGGAYQFRWRLPVIRWFFLRTQSGIPTRSRRTLWIAVQRLRNQAVIVLPSHIRWLIENFRPGVFRLCVGLVFG
ncbi:hypothetical protein J2S89_001969 [Arthrobacter bambusae]|nr:hypothetical protein [Arthrobacter bambusae]MDQ0097827.1 hypothetical protein [Arthrobacter bambusae]